jgi:hypothetical protein
VLVKSPAWARVVKVLDDQILGRQRNSDFEPLKDLNDAFEHNTQVGERLGLTLAKNMPELMFEEFKQQLEERTPDATDS